MKQEGNVQFRDKITGALLVLGAITIAHPMQAQSATMDPFLSTLNLQKCTQPLKTLINSNTGYWAGVNYQLPTAEQIAAYGSLFNGLDQMSASAVQSAMSSLGMSGCIVNEIPDMAFFSVPLTSQLVQVFWRFGAMKKPGESSTYSNPVDPLILLSPHTGNENYTYTLMAMLASTNARATIFETVISHSAETKAADGTIIKNYYLADGAHNTSTSFFQAFEQLTHLYPSAFYAQLSGMATYSNNILLLQEGGNPSNFVTSTVSGARLFGLGIHAILPEMDYQASGQPLAYQGLIHISSAFAETPALPGSAPMTLFTYANNMYNIASEPHYVGAGQYIHMELGGFFRSSQKQSTLLAQALSLAMHFYTHQEDPQSNSGTIPVWAYSASECQALQLSSSVCGATSVK